MIDLVYIHMILIVTVINLCTFKRLSSTVGDLTTCVVSIPEMKVNVAADDDCKADHDDDGNKATFSKQPTAHHTLSALKRATLTTQITSAVLL